MNTKPITIRTFETSDADSVNKLIRGIQKKEFGFTLEDFPQPELLDIKNFYISSGGNFWVAYMDDLLVGTSALLDLGNGVAKLGRMFVHPDYRGKPWRIAQRLFDISMNWAKAKNLFNICLETTPEPCAAHNFYIKNGFIEVNSSDFPPEYHLCPYPSRYFIKELVK